MSLPVDRNTTYAQLSQLKSADLNTIQDLLAGLSGYAHFRDDFWKLDGDIWDSALVGLGLIQAPTGSHVARIATGAVGGNTSTLHTITPGGPTFGQLEQFPRRMRARIKFVSTLADRLDFIGLSADNTTSNLRLGFGRDTAVFPQVFLYVRGGGGLEQFDTGWTPAGADNWYVVEVIVEDDSTVSWSVRLGDDDVAPFISGTETLASAITDTSDLVAIAHCGTLTAAGRALEIDYLDMLSRRPE